MRLPKIYLLRHGQTVWNAEGRYQGQLNSPLTLKGKEQAKANGEKLVKHLKGRDEFVFYSSPLGRALSTAKIIADIIGFNKDKIVFDDRIQEINYGIFEGKTKHYCQTELKEQFEAREANKWSYTLEGGESYETVTIRLREWLSTLDSKKPIVIVAHEMINRTLRGIYLGLENEVMLKLRQPNDVLIVLDGGKEDVLQ